MLSEETKQELILTLLGIKSEKVVGAYKKENEKLKKENEKLMRKRLMSWGNRDES